MKTTKELIEHIEEMKNDRGYTEIRFDSIEALSPKAVLIKTEDEEIWLPYSQLRHLDGEVYATEWILEQKGLL